MATNHLVLVANPGSASRKYALFDGGSCLIKIHFEHVDDKLVYSCEVGNDLSEPTTANLSHLTFAASKVFAILHEKGFLEQRDQIHVIALRVVAPSSYFQTDRLLDENTIDKLAALEPRASLHIAAGLQESRMLKQFFPKAKVIGVSDSSFHKTIPDHARNYAISIKDSELLDIKRFGYHGLSVESSVHTLKNDREIPEKLIVCHLGSGASITAVRSGKSIDNSMGYSPLEGLMMSTRSGNIDITAAQVLQDELKFNPNELQDYLNHKSGLYGVSGESSDIRLLLKLEDKGNINAKVALDMYIYRVRQTIGQMAAALGGIDALVFTGTVGERSSNIRNRIIYNLEFLGLKINNKANEELTEPNDSANISSDTSSAKIYVIKADEYSIIAKHANKYNHQK